MVSLFASGMSHASKSAPDSISVAVKATFLASRSSLAITNVARSRPKSVADAGRGHSV